LLPGHAQGRHRSVRSRAGAAALVKAASFDAEKKLLDIEIEIDFKRSRPNSKIANGLIEGINSLVQACQGDGARLPLSPQC
jgi:hypothetical protein